MPRAFAVPLCVLCLMAGQVRAADDVVAVSLTERTALHPGWIPLVAPVSLLVPGMGNLIQGDRATAKTMLWTGGASFAVALGGAALVALTGAGDIPTAFGVPIAMVGVSSFFSLGITSAIGAFSEDGEAFHPLLLKDAWNNRLRTGVTLGGAPRAGWPGDYSVSLFGEYRAERWSLMLEGGYLPVAPDGWLNATAGVRLLNYTAAVPRAGLWLEGGVQREWMGRLGFDDTRLRLQLVSTLPMGLISGRFGKVTTQLRAGIDPTWTRYRGNGAVDFELTFSGGFDVRYSLHEYVRPFVGYEHSRNGLLGGTGTGFLGTFYGGVEVLLPQDLVVSARGLVGTPNGFFATVEWRH